MDLSTSLHSIFSLDNIRTEFDIADAFLQLDEVTVVTGCSTQQLVTTITKHESGLLELLLSSSTSTEAATRVRNFLLKPWPVSRSQLPTIQLEVLHRFSELFTSLASATLLPTTIAKSQKRAANLQGVLSALDQLRADRSGDAFGSTRSPPPSPTTSRRMSRASEPQQNAFQKAGLAVPRSLEDFDALMERCVRECGTLMETYLGYATSPEVAKHARRQFLIPPKTGKTEKALASFAGSGTAFDLNDISRLGPEHALTYLRDGAEDGKWPVILAHRALKEIRQLASRDTTVFHAVQLRIRELREGFFPERNQKQFLDSKYAIPLYQTDVGGDISIVYQIDCGGPAEDPAYESQYIRVYDITKVDPAFWRSVAKQLHRKDKGYQDRCNARSIPRIKAMAKGINVIPPIQCLRDTSAPQGMEFSDTHEQKALGETLSLELHRILALEKFIPYSQKLFKAIQTEKDGTFMFAMSAAERDIIRHNSSCLVLGRSGTGKTTTMMFKMLAYGLAADETRTFYRQMFVTQSPALAEKIRLYHDRLKNSSLDMDEDSAAQSSAMPNFTLDDIASGQRSTSNAMPALPTRFSDLKNSDFPLFLSFEELCELLASDLDLAFDAEMLSVQTYRPQKSRPAAYRQGLITFKFFKAELWPKIGIRGFDPMLVYNDFMGVIKGTEQTLGSASGFLTRSSYEGLSARTHPTFASQRREVYDMFEAYLRLRPNRTYDAADRTHALLKAIKENGGVPGTPVDFLYVDEAQDNLLVDAALLRQLCPNPHGLFYAGDTAQTVSAGSSFRFNDLKAFLWRLERNEPLVQRGGRAAVDPTFFGLSTNYRSHAGIIRAAAFIVTLLGRLFPNSVDQLEPERALVHGPRPIFFLNRPGETPFGSFVAGDSAAQQQLEFGSDQVIIVRDEAARERLIQKIGNRAGIVMTLYASKGQEFNDVLLYDFFADSPASRSDWRSLFLAESDSLHAKSPRASSFDRDHAVLQTELKCMYVGITRARERVWFWDTSDKGGSWKDLMSLLGLATFFEPHQSVPNLAVKSTAREWALRGKECFQREDFANAVLCFENAGMSWWKSVAVAYETRQTAEALPRDNRHRRGRYLTAAKYFSTCALGAPSKDKHRLLTSSARCYAEAEDHKLAAETFTEVQLYNDALHHFRLAGLFDEAMSLIGKHRLALDPELVETVEDVARVVFTRKGEVKKARKLFKTADDHLEFLEDNGFEAQQVTILQDLALHDRAADVFLQQKQYVSAVSEFLLSATPGSDQRATTCLLDALKTQFSLATGYQQTDSTVPDLFKLGQHVPMTTHQKHEFVTFQAVSNRNASTLAALANQLLNIMPHLALLCLDAWVELIKGTPLGPEPSSLDAVISTLQTYLQFGRLIRHFSHPRNILGPNQPQWIYGLSSPERRAAPIAPSATDDSEGVVVMPNSLVYNAACVELARGLGIRSDAGVILPMPNVADLLRRALTARLNTVIKPLLEKAFQAKHNSPFDICVRYTTNQKCPNAPCVKQHVELDDFSVEFVNRRVYLHLLLIGVLDYFSVDGQSRFEVNDRKARQGLWLMRLFETCYPPSMNLGSVSDIIPSLIPDFADLISVAKAWCQELYCNQRTRHNFFLSNTIACAMLGSTLDYQNATHYLVRASWERRHLVVESGLNWFFRQAKDRHTYGVQFIDRAISQKLPIDIGVLIPFVEDVSLQLIMNYGHHQLVRYNGMALPRSWMIRAFQQGPSFSPNGDEAFELVHALGRLLSILESGEGGDLNSRQASLFNISRDLRSFAMGRVCRVMALLGHNLGHTWRDLRRITHQIFQGLAARDRKPSPAYIDYYSATIWNDISQAMASSLSSSRIDEVVVIFNNPPPQTMYQHSNIRQIVWKEKPDLMGKLLIGTHVAAIVPFLKVAAPVATNQPRQDRGGLQQVERTTKERQAAYTIQRAFGRHQKRLQGGAGGPIFDAYAALTPADNSMATKIYFIHLRGVMPKVMKYMDKLLGICRSAKKEMNSRMQSAAHRSLEDIRRDGKEIRLLLTNVRALNVRLGPQSLTHAEGSLDNLKDQVQQILALRNQAAKFHPEMFTEDEGDTDYQDGVLFMLAPLRESAVDETL